MDKERSVLEDNIRHTYMSVVWSHKIQEKEADIQTEKFKCYETLRIFCASATSVGLISLIFIDEFCLKIISAIVSFISTSISMFFKSFEIQSNISNHKKIAVDLLIIRDKLKLLLVEINLNNINIEDIYYKYEELQNQLGTVYKEAPNTTDKAVDRASKALKINKDNEFSDEEIDANLPKSLQRRS